VTQLSNDETAQAAWPFAGTLLMKKRQPGKLQLTTPTEKLFSQSSTAGST
jgi:hypothetical protein